MPARSSPAPTTGGRRGSSSSSEPAVTDARELAELISSDEAVPASGWVAGVSGAFAAALVAKAAARSEGWSELGGARAQAVDLRDRLLELAAEDALRLRVRARGARAAATTASRRALAVAAEVPLALAEAAADVALLAADAPSAPTAPRAPTQPPPPRWPPERRGPPPSSSRSTSRPSPATSGSRPPSARSRPPTTRARRRSRPRSSSSGPVSRLGAVSEITALRPDRPGRRGDRRGRGPLEQGERALPDPGAGDLPARRRGDGALLAEPRPRALDPRRRAASRSSR